MTPMIRAGFLGLALALSLAACKRREEAPAAPVKADTSTISFQKIDTTAGTGAEARAGSHVTVNYTGWLYLPDAPDHHGEKFDSSIGRKPFTFRLGSGMVIPGWDQGVDGMKVGGKRTLVIPAALGYGAEGAGPIPPNANLIFDVELLDVQ
ncbi:FKBP-type peptidyl-prolyl cis-trans isomerase [Massilia sp. CT11-137]|uniref:FKBP-type peptidyl-prolyl cis-trans isomerase n=1 Tax=Massilia sp. CT11-137 TaxID=3393901 RepID=UPI0039A64CA5